MKIAKDAAFQQLAQSNELFKQCYEHGSLQVEIYKPHQIDLQKPHERDEVYVIISGSGKFEQNRKVIDFAPHDVIFVPAHVPHHFFDFTDDFCTWVMFYGPKHGEIPLVVDIKSFQPNYQPDFYSLNKQWIEVDYNLEPLDLAVLGDPQTHIIDKGGSILCALVDNTVIGVVALRPFEEKSDSGETTVFKSLKTTELTKMAVDPAWRGLGVGEKLMLNAIEEARKLGFHKIILFSNTKTSAGAVKLYRKLNFKEVTLEDGLYKRADIKMEYKLTSPPTVDVCELR